MELQLTSTQQELKDTLELCGQYKILVEERISSRIRCMCVVCVSVYLYVCCVRACCTSVCLSICICCVWVRRSDMMSCACGTINIL